MSSELAALYDVADDNEIVLLDDLALRAGLVWRCSSCHWMNDPKDAACDGCGAAKEAEVTDPKVTPS